MKWMFKWLFRLGLFVIVLVAALVLSKDAILKAVAEQRIRAQTGMDVKIGRLSVGIFSPVVTIENLKLYNRPEFGGTPFIDILELYVEYDRVALAQRKLHITLLRFNLAELNVVRNESGQTNLVSLMAKRDPKQNRKRTGDFEFAGIDVLNLSLGKVRFLDLKDPQQNGELDLGVKNQVFRNVNSEGDVFGVLFMMWLRSGDRLNAQPTNQSSRMLSPPATGAGHNSQAPAATPGWPLKK